ncbi:MAG: IS1634 family transposase, partial [Planctomycetaceae bacterium]|nr:IS1634 family transposase [Planctomycetaceae bacterium]
RQRVVATLGRLDQLQQSGQLDALLVSGARLARSVLVLSEHAQGKLPTISIRHIGPALVFQRLWQLTGCQHVIQQLLKGRRFEFSIERAVFLTVLHRLFDPGSDRAADKWKNDYEIEGCEDLQLHHLYRAMGWLGDDLPRKEQADKTPFAPRCNKDLIEEALFARRRDLFTELHLVFFDTTSIYFEGEGGERIGQRGHSKDHRPDLKQMIVGAVLDGQGRPICCELWPGNTTDVTTLIPVVDRLRSRFGVTKVCIVADRGMISKETIEELEKQERGWQYILGARMRSQNEVKDEVLARADRYRVVHPERQTSEDPAPLKVKEVQVEGRRYIVCRNEDEARKDAADREAIVASLQEKLRSGEKSLVGNKGYRRYLSSTGPDHFQIDEAKIKEEARYDGKWVLRTNADLDAAEVALQYKQLWMVEAWFRSSKSLLQTRPIYHKCDETIRGHVFCSFLALVLRQELEVRLAKDDHNFEWADVIQDLDRLQMVEVEQDGKRFLLRSEVQGTCGTVFRAAGVAVPPTVQQAKPDPAAPEPDPGATPRM